MSRIIHTHDEISMGIVNRTFMFEDDTSVTIDMSTMECVDMDGMATVPEHKQQAVNDTLGQTAIY